MLACCKSKMCEKLRMKVHLYKFCGNSGTGKSVMKALEVLKQHNVDEKKVIVLTLFATPDSKQTCSVSFFTLCFRSITLELIYFCCRVGKPTGSRLRAFQRVKDELQRVAEKHCFAVLRIKLTFS